MLTEKPRQNWRPPAVACHWGVMCQVSSPKMARSLKLVTLCVMKLIY